MRRLLAYFVNPENVLMAKTSSSDVSDLIILQLQKLMAYYLYSHWLANLCFLTTKQNEAFRGTQTCTM